jgi:ankyrin repeat protein
MLHVFLTILSIFSASFVFAIDQSSLGEKRERFEDEDKPSSKKMAIFLLHKACEEGDIEQVKKLLMTENINQKNEHGSTPALMACIGGHSEIVNIFLKQKDLVINAFNEEGNTLLHLACIYFRDEKAEIIKDIIAHKQISADFSNKIGETPLMTACVYNNLKAVKILLQHPDIDVNFGDKKDVTPLIFACLCNNEKLVKKLLKHPKTDVNATCKVNLVKKYHNSEERQLNWWRNPIDKQTSLHIACDYGYEKIVELLLKNNNIDINKITKVFDYTALIIAINKSKVKIAEMLLKQTTTDLYDGPNYIDVLIETAKKNKKIDENNELIIKAFIEHKWEAINDKDKKKLLELCTKHNKAGLVALILDKKNIEQQQIINDVVNLGDIKNEQIQNIISVIELCEMKNYYSESEENNFNINEEEEKLFLLACSKNHKDISEIFMKNFNFNHDLQNKALLELSKCNGKDKNDLTQLLINNNADVNSKDIDGFTPLHYACKQSNIELTQLLINNNADVNSKDIHGSTPLQYACKQNNIELTQLLINNNADVNLKDIDGSTPLHYACQKNNLKSIELLINNNADINSKNNYGHTPLYHAVDNKSLNAVLMLVNNYKDADLLLTDITTEVNGYYILDIALDKYHSTVRYGSSNKKEVEEIVELLMEKGALYKEYYNEQEWAKDLLIRIKTKFLEQNTKGYLDPSI